VRWTGRLIYVGDMRNVLSTLFGKPEEKDVATSKT
jgi:hypothetical protein